jgi:hypothetical protein
VKLLARLRPRLSYANVIATLALFLVLGGGAAFAATQLPKNSVGARQLKKHAVTPAKLSASTVNQLRGATGPQGPKGAKGATGAKGAKGDVGPRGQSGAKGDTGATGQDAGPLFLGLTSGPGVEFPEGADSNVVAARLKDLPAGSYAVAFKGQILSEGEEALVVKCELEAGTLEPSGGEPDINFLSVPAVVAGPPYTSAIVFQTGVSFAQAGGELLVACELGDGEEVEESPTTPSKSALAIILPRLSATKVPSISIQEEEGATPIGMSTRLRKLGFGG